ncbi:MAG: SPFH domain-containing protein [Arthrospira sp. SH-MAG29]|nr:SPFH domain-containing protein [Arthrospira sp. SH-MAG29]MBS0017683.1 SPFH domain-containing protein [Arthrospira sp. SH-MAG29]
MMMKTAPIPNLLGLTGCAILVSMSISSCGVIPGTSVKRIPPGYVGLKVQMYGSNRGVQNATISTGKVWYNAYAEEIIIFPDHVQYYILTSARDEGSPVDESISFGVGGTSVNADISLSYFFNTNQIKDFYGKYLKDPDEFKATLVRSELRNCFNQEAAGLRPEDIVGSKQRELLTSVENCLNEKFVGVGVEFDSIGFVSKPRFDSAIEAQMTARFQAEQQVIAAQAQLQVAQAEAERQLAKAQADAEAARISASTVNPMTIRLRELELQEKMIEKWNGVLPLYQGGVAPFPSFDPKPATSANN